MHSERLTVFCTTCDQSICHRCALFDGRHGKHSFQPLDVVYSKHIELIRAEMDRLKARRTSINTIIQQVVSPTIDFRNLPNHSKNITVLNQC